MKNYITPILNELESIKHNARAIDKKLQSSNYQTDDLAYVLKKLEEISEFLQPSLK